MPRYWYSTQTYDVKWAGPFWKCIGWNAGRGRGIDLYPPFNLYINRLIVKFCGICVGCHIDGTCVNNISYANVVVLLSPSIIAMMRLLEKYAEFHGRTTQRQE